MLGCSIGTLGHENCVKFIIVVFVLQVFTFCIIFYILAMRVYNTGNLTLKSV